MIRQDYQEYHAGEPRLKYDDIFRYSDIYWIHRMMIDGRVTNRSVSDEELEVKYPYGIPELVAMMPDSYTQNAHVRWIAAPYWGQVEYLAIGLNRAAPPGMVARIASWNGAMPGDLFGHVREIFIALKKDKGSTDGPPMVEIGTAQAGRWISWDLNFPEQPVPDIADEEIWITGIT